MKIRAAYRTGTCQSCSVTRTSTVQVGEGVDKRAVQMRRAFSTVREVDVSALPDRVSPWTRGHNFKLFRNALASAYGPTAIQELEKETQQPSLTITIGGDQLTGKSTLARRYVCVRACLYVCLCVCVRVCVCFLIFCISFIYANRLADDFGAGYYSTGRFWERMGDWGC